MKERSDLHPFDLHGPSTLYQIWGKFRRDVIMYLFVPLHMVAEKELILFLIGALVILVSW